MAAPLLVDDDTILTPEGLNCYQCSHCWLFDQSEWLWSHIYECCEFGSDDQEIAADAEFEFRENLVNEFGKTLQDCIEGIAMLEPGQELPSLSSVGELKAVKKLLEDKSHLA